MTPSPPSPLRLPPSSYDALLLVSFGGPEGPEEVVPFLENVVRGKGVPRERLLEVAKHYETFGGKSPINAQMRALQAALIAEFDAHGPRLPVYWGNRNWRPTLADAVRQMADDGIRRALAFVTSAFGSYSGCRQYREDIERACQSVGPEAPTIDKLRLFYNHPGFIESAAECAAEALERIPSERRTAARLLFTAHSLPTAMARTSPYERQLREACRLVAERLGPGDWELVYQSRSGPPGQAWLEPDICTRIRQLHETGRAEALVVVPIGFLTDHIEVRYDLDIEACALCGELGIEMTRAATPGSRPRFVRMVRELIAERFDASASRLALGSDGPWPDECPADCCR